MCIAASVYQTHFCLKAKYKNNCPVCHDDMFSSRQAPQDLPCGHAIHAHCFRKLAGFDYRCPICKKTVVSQQSMSAAWEARARDIADHPMPPDLQRVVDIICNDCENRSSQQQWHFLGIQCPRCSSFNTVVEQVVSSGGTSTTATTTTTNGGTGPPNDGQQNSNATPPNNNGTNGANGST
jgi:RING finger and CHY zinc finger domain-containing protein 1